MPPISVLIKPVSGLCNMRCKYCFYEDEMQNREQYNYGMMSESTLEMVIKKTLFTAENVCTIAFQGGEPTLAGLAFYEQVIEFQNRYNVNHVTIHNAIQTNGYAITEEWAKFFTKNHFLVGLSLDGIKRTNNEYRLDGKNNGTFENVMKTMDLFEKYKVEYNILTVVNSSTAKNVERIYSFYKKNKLKYLQFIPCLDPLETEWGKQPYSLTPKMYGEFLCKLFDLWYQDYILGEHPYIRQFENYVGMILGYPPEACGQGGMCSIQNVIEADGSIYPCDFYVLDQYKMGNLCEQDYKDLDYEGVGMKFLEESKVTSPTCKECSYYALCRCGCKRNRIFDEQGKPINYFCESYKQFFDYTVDRIRQIAARCIR